MAKKQSTSDMLDICLSKVGTLDIVDMYIRW